MKYWPHQDRAHEECRRLYASGCKSWCIVAPPGAGKSLMMQRLALPAAAKGVRVALYCHRVMLTKQTIGHFEKQGVEFGVVANGFDQYKNEAAPIQICSLQTVNSRLGDFRHEFPRAGLVIVDEAHQQTGEMAQAVFGRHAEEGAKRIGFTATPVDLAGLYDELIVAAQYRELLECKSHLPIVGYGPDRPDLSSLRPMKSGDFSSNTDKKINRVPTIIGRVYEYWKKLNPDALPAIGFAPGVAESKWFVDEFRVRGVPCAHIDGERIQVVEPNANGVLTTREYPSDDSIRQDVLQGSQDGRYKIVWNRFVLREAIDMPWLYHAIVATSMGALSSWLQSVGRVARYWDQYQSVVLQDHGGNIDRHGMPNEERDWQLGDTNNTIHRREVEQRQKKKGDDAEPICCPKCCAYRLSGPQCPNCNYMHQRSVRMVRQLDGELVRKTGRVVKHKAPKSFDDYMRSAIYGCWHTGKTVKQAYFLAQQRAKSAGIKAKPDKFPLPTAESDSWQRSVREVYPNMKPKGGSVK